MKKINKHSKLLIYLGTAWLMLAQWTYAQTITGINGYNDCVVNGLSYNYQISDYWAGLDHKWCITGGTINGSTCFTNNNVNTVEIKWNTTATTGTISYYRPSTASSPTATFTVNIIQNAEAIAISSSEYAYPFYPGGVPISISYTGADANAGCTHGTRTYQWYTSTDGTNWTALPGATGKDYTLSGTFTQNMTIKRTVGDFPGGSGVVSASLILQFKTPPTPGAINPAEALVSPNTSPGTLTAPAATGGDWGTQYGPNYSYSWQRSTDNKTWSTISGATALSYTPDPLSATTWFRQWIRYGPYNTYGTPAKITVLNPGTIGPASAFIPYNTSPGELGSLVDPSGGSIVANYIYQWEYSTDGANYTPIAVNGNSTSYFPAALTNTGPNYYRRKVTYGTNGPWAYTNRITIVVAPDLVPGTISLAGSMNIPYNTAPGQFTATPSTGGYSSSCQQYTWQSSTDNITWTNLTTSSSSGLSYTPGALVGTTYFRLMTTCGDLTVYSNIITVNVTGEIFPGEINPSQYTVTTGSDPGLLAGGPAKGGSCNNNFIYEWQSSTNNGATWQTLTNSNALTYKPGPVTVTTLFRRMVSCSIGNAYSNICKVTVLGAAPDMNYVRTRRITKPAVTDLATANALASVKDIKQNTEYIDGLGRTVQEVQQSGSMITGNSPVDLVSPVIFDEFGRKNITYLAYPANNVPGNSASLNNGDYRVNPLGEQYAYYNQQFGAQGENFYFQQTRFEASPLNRVTATISQGDSWAVTEKGINKKYLLNTTTDDVKSFTVQNSTVPNNFASYQYAGNYDAGELQKLITTDEQGKQVIEYKDKYEQLILKKVQLSAPADDGTGSGYTGWLSTYYIYDELNLLRAVVQPAGVDLLRTNGWDFNALSGNTVNEQCFRYEYDQRNRMIIKNIPGAGMAQMVYDMRDRLVMTQDANMRRASQMEWLVTQYDELNRPSATYKITDPAHFNNADYHRQLAKNSSNYPDVASFSNELLSETHYNNYNGLPGGFSTQLAASGYGTYLDAAADEYPESLTPTSAVNGLTTWAKTKVLGENKYIVSCNLYDEKQRLLQAQSLNYTADMDILTNQYNFSGQLLRSHTNHRKTGTPEQVTDIGTKNTYDKLNRLIKIEKNLNNGGWKQIDTMVYDELGQLKMKTLSPSGATGGAPLETLSYDYNIRGWLLGVNRAYATTTGDNSHFFGYDLGYDKTTISTLGSYTAAQYNGNIAGTVWKSKGDGEIRKYDFNYDAVNRLTGAVFKQYNAGFNTTAGVDFSVSNLTYDANGNILTMNQSGLQGSGSTLIDQLHYTYEPGTNRLKNVIDFSSGAGLGDFATSNNHPQLADKNAYMANPASVDPQTITDYNYDSNGNLVLDNNKDVAAITYNYLNLPQTITLKNNKGSIDYVYDAKGNKLKKVTHETGKPDKTTLYLYGTYEDDVLQFLPMEEGRIRPLRDANGSITGYTFDYFLKDHIGNVRMVLTEEQQQHIYPAATLEGDVANASSAVNKEQEYYSIKPGSIVDKSTAFRITDYENNNGSPPYNNNPNSSAAALSQKVYKLNASTPMGLGITLKVMAGDKINIFGKSYYYQSGKQPARTDLPLLATDLLKMFVTGQPIQGKGITGNGLMSNVPGLNTALSTYLKNHPTPGTGKPRAYINWVMFDDKFHFVGGGNDPVGDANVVKTHDNNTIPTIPVTKNGYIFVYCNNETQTQDVFFDNLQVIQTPGPILEETHYYPFGLTMAGISSTALSNAPQNKFKYNKYELNTDFDLNLYESFYRTHDPQLGRFWQIDPKPDFDRSLYSAMDNNPLRYGDILGDTIIYMIDNDGAAGSGHLAMFIQNEKGEWFFFSQGAAENAGTLKMLSSHNIEGGVTLGKITLSDKRPKTDSKGNPIKDKDGKPVMEEVQRNPTQAELVNIAKAGVDGNKYDQFSTMNTTKEQDRQVYENALDLQAMHASTEKKYNLYFNNCVDACQDAVQTNTGINLPYEVDPRPNSYWNDLNKYVQWFNLPAAEKQKQIDAMVKKQRAEMAREPKY